jgi:hypothetical protein
MPRKRWARVPWGVERVVLSDVLPYELPVSLGNVGFGELLAKLDVRWDRNSVSSNWLGPSTPSMLSILLGGPVSVTKPATGKRVSFSDPRLSGDNDFPRARALSYNIGKNAGGVRTVAVMHPRTQMAVAEFYRRHTDSILYFTGRSPFSIRHPADVARYTVSRDGVFADVLDNSAVGVEQEDREYERLRSYFTYGGYSHIYKFHESAEVRRLERRFPRLVHVDVTRCFDSVYTHTISWVTNGVEDSKTRTRLTADTFGGRFDKLMQSANDLETHGILIGPEVSRIFAEIILQEVDVRVERVLRAGSRHLHHRRDYEIRRFVDDYFIFCSAEEDAKRIVTVLGDELKLFKMYLNDAKRKDELTPLASERSVAKYQLKNAIRKLVEVTRDDDAALLPRLVTSAEGLLLEYKGVLLATGLGHTDLANYALVELEFAFEHALNHWRTKASVVGAPTPVESDWIGLARFISSIVDVAAAIFAGGVSASHSVKLARIAHTALKFMAIVMMPQAIRAGVESKIASELVAHVRRGEHETDAPMHALVLLDALASMSEDGALGESSLRDLLNLGTVPPNAIALLTSLRYCGARSDLAALRSDLEQLAIEVAREALTSHSLDTGATILAAALLDSPFQSNKFKRQLSAALGLPGNPRPGGSSPWTRFFQWEIPDYYEALQRKRGGDVY